MGLCIRLRRAGSSVCCAWAPYLSENPLRFRESASPRDLAATPVVEEYQIAFLCDNFFLLTATIEIKLADAL